VSFPRTQRRATASEVKLLFHNLSITNPALYQVNYAAATSDKNWENFQSVGKSQMRLGKLHPLGKLPPFRLTSTVLYLAKIKILYHLKNSSYTIM